MKFKDFLTGKKLRPTLAHFYTIIIHIGLGASGPRQKMSVLGPFKLFHFLAFMFVDCSIFTLTATPQTAQHSPSPHAEHIVLLFACLINWFVLFFRVFFSLHFFNLIQINNICYFFSIFFCLFLLFLCLCSVLIILLPFKNFVHLTVRFCLFLSVSPSPSRLQPLFDWSYSAT